MAVPGISNIALPAEQIAFHGMSCGDFAMYPNVPCSCLAVACRVRFFLGSKIHTYFYYHSLFGARDPESERKERGRNIIHR